MEIGHLAPLPRTREQAEVVIRNLRALHQAIPLPFILENITAPFELPGKMTEAEFFRRILESADCGLLLDVTNAMINSHNLEMDLEAWLSAMPLERVVQLHLARGTSRAALVAGQSHRGHAAGRVGTGPAGLRSSPGQVHRHRAGRQLSALRRVAGGGPPGRGSVA